MSLQNSSNHVYSSSLEAKPSVDWTTKALVYPDGTVSVVAPAQLVVHCGRPRELHANWACELKFGSWTHNGNELNLLLESEEANIDEYNARVWSITENKAVRTVQYYECCPEAYIDVTYSIKLLRN